MLDTTLTDIRKRIDRAGSKGLNENNTKATLIEPILRALGWDIEEVEEVAREYRLKARDKPVDYALLALREPRLFVKRRAWARTSTTGAGRTRSWATPPSPGSSGSS